MTSSGTTDSYDGNGLRVKKVLGSTTTVYVFSGSKVVAEYDNGAAPASPTREYIYSGGALVAKIEGSATNYFHQDHLSNRVVTDSTGTVVEQKGHYPFGESWYEGGTPNKLKFTSYERDAESGNDYAVFRYHVNRLGRFNSPDLIAGAVTDPQTLNRYAYTRSDPANLVDPLGLYFEWIDGCLYNISAGKDDTTIYTLIRCGPDENLGSRHLFITLAMADDFRNGPLDRGRGPGGERPTIGPAPPPPLPCRIEDPFLGALGWTWKVGLELAVSKVLKVGGGISKDPSTGETKSELGAEILTLGGKFQRAGTGSGGSAEFTGSLLGFEHNFATGETKFSPSKEFLRVGGAVGIGGELSWDYDKFKAISAANDKCRAAGGR